MPLLHSHAAVHPAGICDNATGNEVDQAHGLHYATSNFVSAVAAAKNTTQGYQLQHVLFACCLACFEGSPWRYTGEAHLSHKCAGAGVAECQLVNNNSCHTLNQSYIEPRL